MQKKRFSLPWSKYISGFLVFILLVSQTIRVDFFDTAEASPENYRDIISIFVDKETYDDARTEVLRYVRDVEGYLGGTRASVFVVDEDTPPAVLAAKNERLYYEGDGEDGASYLIGTILIGNIPTPMVGQDGEYFPSLYPYVDFVDKQFVYNDRSGQYETAPNSIRNTTEAEIWHGVINPSVGRIWKGKEDVVKIKNFLNKTHDFYTKSGKFSPSIIPPRVFYYDGFYESQSVNLRKFFQYGLSMQNAENVAYKRFTKYLLKNVNDALLQFDSVNNQEYNEMLSSLGIAPGQDGLDDETIMKMPDIQTPVPIQSFLKDFKSIINEKTLGDAMLYVHNAGRYTSGATVRVDLSPVTMTLMDEVARSTLREANDTLQDVIDEALRENNYAKKIPIFDRVETSTGVPLPTSPTNAIIFQQTATGAPQVYTNFFFGLMSTGVLSPEQCSIARGSNVATSQFGKDVLVEANTAYDISSVSGQIDKLRVDTEELMKIYKKSKYSCFDASTGKAKLTSYWGGNSILRIAGSSGAEMILDEPPGATSLSGFSEPIFSLGGMKETSRMNPPSIADCMSSEYQYGLKPPHQVDYPNPDPESGGGSTCYDIFPKEWSSLNRFASTVFGTCGAPVASHPPRYTCITEHDILPVVPKITDLLAQYDKKNSRRTCYAGSIFLDGKAIKRIERTCIVGNDNGVIDTTTYEDHSFHTIPSILRHISPTDEEILAAKKNGVTPSLPVDMIRYVEFLTPKGNIARLTYPNFFDTPGTDIPSVRAWLKIVSQSEWNEIINTENATSLSALEIEANTYLSGSALPSSPIDWNEYISDDFISKVLQAKNWLNPDVTAKYKQAIETSLSYSHEYNGRPIYESPPKLPTLSDSYELAYLGLTSFLPSSSDDTDFNQIQDDYSINLAEIDGLNVSDPYDGSDNNPYKDSDKCGPPEGVDIFKWPQAILCWIQSLLPPRILAGSCGGNTIGKGSGTTGIRTPPPSASASGAAMREFYEGGRLVYSIQRTSMMMNDVLPVELHFTKDGSVLQTPTGTEVTLKPVQSLGAQYLSIAPEVSIMSDGVAKFVLSSGDKVTDVSVEPTIKIPLPGGEYYSVTGDKLVIHVTDEYLDIIPESGNSFFPVTSASGVSFQFSVKNDSGEVLEAKFPMKLEVYDDVDGTLVGSGIVISSPSFTLPEKYSKKVGVYHLVFEDALARIGEITIGIQSGPLSQVSFTPISSMIIKGANTLGMIELKDALSNLTSPDLHSLDITIKGGYLIDAAGNKKTSMHIDAMEPQIPLFISADDVGEIRIDISADTALHTSATIKVIESARLILSRPSTPEVGGDIMDMSLRVVDGAGNILSGFNSVANLSLPESAGYFTPAAIPIKGGAAAFTYTPGTYAGDHALVADIPGIGKVPDIIFSLAPGIPMYITHKEEGGNLIFSIRDRYGNQVNTPLVGAIKRNNDAQAAITFVNGEYKIPRRSGYYIVKAPELETSTLIYTDASGEHSISGIPYYATYIEGAREHFDFLPDYNARYTILAGGDFLREGEDILYNTTPGESQSLAVSTLLDSPYQRNTLFSIIPGGGFSLQDGIDSAISTEMTIEQGYPVLNVTDIVSHAHIARAVYRMSNAVLDTCNYNGIDLATTCLSSIKDGHIRLALDGDSGFQSGVYGNNIILQKNSEALVTIWKDGRLTLSSGISLVPDVENSRRVLVMDIVASGQNIGKIIYGTNTKQSVEKSENPFTASVQNTPVLDASSSVSSESFSQELFGSDVFGYRFLGEVSLREIDMTKNGPNTIDSLAITPETPGVGWRGNNRMALSYAAGDTVGEATKYFHTFTFVNLGDPVAHVDANAPGTEMEGIDRTIGTQITSMSTQSIASFSRRDMDADGYEDIVTLHTDGYLALLLNQRGKFRFRENISFVPDLVTRGVSLGDFQDDNYADIVGVNNSGSLVYIDNDARRFARMEIRIPGVSGGVPAGVSQFKIYDMNADGKDDIVYLTEGGELGILYGTDSQAVFDKKILDSSLGISLSTQSESIGGALRMDGIPQFEPGELGTSPTTSTGVDETQLQSEVYYQYSRPVFPVGDPEPMDISDPDNLNEIIDDFSTTLSGAESSSAGVSVDTYIKSEYAPAVGLDIARSFRNISNATLHAGDRIEVTITFKNTGTRTARNIEYLDTIPAIFSSDETIKYQVTLGSETTSRDFDYLQTGDYDAYFVGRDIPVGQTLTIRYELMALPASYGEMLVGDFEKGESGVDIYGDVGFKNSTTCGADMLLWRSGPGSRDYTKGSRTFTQAEIPEGIASQIIDNNNNGTPDSMETIDTDGDGVPDSAAMTIDDRQEMFDKVTSMNAGASSRSLMNATIDTESNSFDIGFDTAAVEELASMAENLVNGLACGFGGGSCMSFPINWAPLAPGSVPTVFGIPMGTLTPATGIPMFSAITGIPVYGPWGCIPVPAVYPASPLGYSTTCTANVPGAGGYLGIQDPTNTVRIYVTPTLTLGMGVAVCLAPALLKGYIPPPGLSPLVPGGNCIVMAAPMPFCKGDGSSGDGDVAGISGLGNLDDTWNAASCTMQASTSTRTEDKNFTQEVIDYLRDPDTSRLNDIYTRLSARGQQNWTGGPLLRIGSGEDGTEIGVEIDSTQPFTLGNIVKVKNKRIAGFPDFIMDWLQRQGDEIVKALFTPPNITIFTPTTLGQHAQFDGSFKNFLSQFSEASIKQGYDDIKTQMGKAYNDTNAAADLSKKAGNTTSGLGKDFASWQQQLINNNSSTINTAAGGLNAMRAAYKFIGKLPFITLSTKNIPINVPWILPSELDRYARAIDGYKREVNQALENWCVGKTAVECANAKASLNSGGFMNSINQNLKRIQEYKQFPVKLQKYVTWKQRYMSQILCNIDTIAQLTGGWLKDNGIRFRKWAELYVLLKAIAESWQPLLDIFFDTSKQCGVCRNERYNAQYWKFKIISMIIPTIPVIKFPRWPNIVLDLSDIQLGINISVPEFQFNLSPIKLPDLPGLSLPNFGLGISLPALPILPAIPPLPDLPDLPSLPKIALPNLPPPPKIPKLFGSISGILKILKLMSTMYCWYQNTNLVPEWQVGDVIANRTERQGNMSLDFLDIQFPNLSVAALKEIRVSTHVNFQLRSDFITEFARAAVKPINNFTTDLSRGAPKKIMDDVNIQGQNININLQSSIDSQSGSLALLKSLIVSLQQENSESIAVESFIVFIQDELKKAGLADSLGLALTQDIAHAEKDQIQQTNELLAYNNERFAALRTYIQAEYDDTAKLQQIIDMLGENPRELVYDDLDILKKSMVSNITSSKNEYLREAYNRQYTVEQHGDIAMESDFNPSAIPGAKNIQARMERIADTTTSSYDVTSNTAAGYAPVFQGIYVMTPSGVQTRLFDYIEPLMGDERVDTVDIDKDGDKDYIFLLDGAIFVKYNHLRTPNKIQDESVKIQTLSKNDEFPSAPNFFHESLNTPNSLSVTFSSARSDDRSWRMEFFDKYLEWDAAAMGRHDESVTPKRTVDLFTQDSTLPVDTFQGIGLIPVSRSLDRVYDTVSFRISGSKMTILTGATNFTVSPGRTLYTGNSQATILYHTGTNTDKTLILDPHRGYRFDESIEARLQNGKLYIMTESVATEPYTYTDDMIGMPILDSMQLSSTQGGFVIKDSENDASVTIAGGSDYMTVNLGNFSDTYNFNIDYPNGYYSARLHALENNSVNAGVILFAPQASSDRSDPVIDIPETIRIPVYSTKTFKLSEYITEMNMYSVLVDPDITVDTNGNVVVDDDFSLGGSGVSISGDSLTIGSFDTPGRRVAQMKVTDAFGNRSMKVFTIEIYTPVPRVDSVTATGWVLGKMNESIPFEPIHLFRVRPGTDVIRLNTGALRTNIEGAFMSGTFFTGSGAELFLGGKKVIMSEHGVFQSIPTGLSVRVDGANRQNPMRISIVGASGSLYSQFVTVPGDVTIVDSSKHSSTGTGKIVILPEDLYRVVPAMMTDPSIPGGNYITDNFYHSIAALGRDGNIYLLDQGASLSYSQRDGYMLINVMKGSAIVAKVWYKLDFFYTVK